MDASGQDPGGRRFRIENGDSLGEKEEVILLFQSCVRTLQTFSTKSVLVTTNFGILTIVYARISQKF